jgi:hypothetical protein
VPGDAHPQGIAVVAGRRNATRFESDGMLRGAETKSADSLGTDHAAIVSSSLFESGGFADPGLSDLTDLAIALARFHQQ